MLRAPLLDGLPALRHGFFTRRGGVSEGIYTSLNCGLGSSDEPERVHANRRRALARLDLAGERLCTVYQHHGNTAVEATMPWAFGALPRADAMVTTVPGLALGILTADCAPVLFADPKAGVIGAAHAGWRGALAGITDATLAAMAERGARLERIRCAIGPCIGKASYEVGPEFPVAFLAACPDNARFFGPAARPEHTMFDLKGYVAARLEAAGVAEVAVLSHDTAAEPEAFFSYRRAQHRGEPDYGRALSAIVLT